LAQLTDRLHLSSVLLDSVLNAPTILKPLSPAVHGDECPLSVIIDFANSTTRVNGDPFVFSNVAIAAYGVP
jgi:hypothetical protein